MSIFSRATLLLLAASGAMALIALGGATSLDPRGLLFGGGILALIAGLVALFNQICARPPTTINGYNANESANT